MPWAKIARVLELSRAPVSVAAAVACAAGMMLGPFRELPQARPFVFGIGFAVTLVAAVVVLTALLALAEHAADRAGREIRIPTATAAYRTGPATMPAPASSPSPASTRAAAPAPCPPRGTRREQA